MSEFKMNEAALPALRRAAYRKLIPVLLMLFVAVLALQWYSNPGLSFLRFTLPFSIAIIALAALFGLRRARRKQLAAFTTYRLRVDANSVARRQFNWPDVAIAAADVAKIVEQKDGSLLVMGRQSQQVILVPSNLENLALAKQLLSQMADIEPQTGRLELAQIQMALNLGFALALLAFVSLSHPLVIFSLGILLWAYCGWRIYLLISQPAAKPAAFRNSLWYWLLIAAFVLIRGWLVAID